MKPLSVIFVVAIIFTCWVKIELNILYLQVPRSLALLHNEKVSKNRKILGRLIDVVWFLAFQELPLRGHYEDENSANRGNYLELLSL